MALAFSPIPFSLANASEKGTGGETFVDFFPSLAGQRVPFWFLQRGIISGSSVGKNGAGYWVERDASEAAAAVAAGATGETFTPQVKARMRQGRIEEPAVLLTYLHGNPTHVFYEQGYIVMSELNKDFGVSPDGLAVDPALNWETFPCAKTREEYGPHTPAGVNCAPGFAGSTIDPTRIALEFKVSAYSSKFPDYYIPQLYWEMIALHAPQARLLRMHTRKNQSGSKCMQYTIYRDRDTENALLANVMRAYEAVYVKKTCKLVDLVNDPAYTAIRARFDKLAKETLGVELQVPASLVADYHAKRQAALQFLPRKPPLPLAKLPPPPETLVNEQGVDDQYLARHTRIKQRLAEKNIAGAVHLCVEQMNAYGQLIKTIFH